MIDKLSFYSCTSIIKRIFCNTNFNITIHGYLGTCTQQLNSDVLIFILVLVTHVHTTNMMYYM
jgi:hypothetical protein